MDNAEILDRLKEIEALMMILFILSQGHKDAQVEGLALSTIRDAMKAGRVA